MEWWMLSSHFTYGSWEWENKGGERERNEHAHEEVRAVQFRAVEFCAKVKFLLLEITVRMFAKASHTLGVLLYLGTGTLKRIVRKRGSKVQTEFPFSPQA